jgi:hypothetical protein
LAALLIVALAMAAAQAPARRVKVESVVDATRNGAATVTNLAPVLLDAYLLEVILEPCNPTQPRSTWRVSDALLAQGTSALRENESRTEALGNSPCNKLGPPTPNRAELRAAIFHDGSTTGDMVSTAMLLDNRRAALAQLDAALTRLKGPDAATAPADRLTADVRTRTAAVDEHPPFPRLLDVTALVTTELTRAPGTRPEQVARAIKTLEAWRQKLLDSKPALR